MKKQFDESKHRRDELGRFAKMSASELKERQTIELKNQPLLTKQEYAMWYNKIGEIKRGGYVNHSENGNMLIPLNNKICITAGTYERPKLLKVLEFENQDLMVQVLNELRR